MNQYAIVLIIVGVALAAFAGGTIISMKLKGKDKDAEKTLGKVETGIDYAQAVAAAVDPFLPKIAGTVITAVLGAAQKAIKHVEATYKAAISADPNATDARKTEATSLVKSALALDGIADTPDVDKLIDAVIPLLVLALPKTHSTADKSAADAAKMAEMASNAAEPACNAAEPAPTGKEVIG